ncbi:claudin-34-like [Rhynchocyon petersi]
MVLVRITRFQLAGFIAFTLGWLLSTTTVGLVEWRVWFITRSPTSVSRVVHVGMWRVCIYDDDNEDGACHYYTHCSTHLPLTIRGSRSLLLIAFLIGFLVKIFLSLTTRNTPFRNLPTSYNPFTAAGLLYLCAAFCVSISVMWSYHCLKINEGISFAPTLQLPFQPDSQQAGVAVHLAAVAAILMLFGSLGVFYKKDPPVSDEAAEP